MTEMKSVATRRSAREIALHIVYERTFDLDNMEGILSQRLSEEGFASLSRDISAYEKELPPEECVYIRLVTKGIEEKKMELADLIRQNSLNWKLERISRISRSILEIAIYEILYMDGIDTSVSINEAVELAKKYDTEDASAFINGVLGGFAKNNQ